MLAIEAFRKALNAIEDSLKRLDTEYVDLYYIHHVDVQTPLEEMLRALDDLVHQGKVRYIACSNYQAWRLSEAVWTSDTKNLARFECYQPQYNLVVRIIEQELIPLCQLKGLGLVVWGPLVGGFLTGKYKPGERSVPGSRSEEKWGFPSRFFGPNADAILSTPSRDIESDWGQAGTGSPPLDSEPARYYGGDRRVPQRPAARRKPENRGSRAG